jgi:FkbM family methyltransferase
MGWVREKYTKTYFTGLKEDGSRAGYGVEGFSETGTRNLRDFDVQILRKISLQGRHVLEFGFGRGESIKYCKERGIASYVGVDFAPPAVELATAYLHQEGIEVPQLYCADAIDFLRSQRDALANPIDVVIMFDFIEHVPRHELRELFALLKTVLSEKPIIVINTPVYAFDNDVIKDGLDVRNHANAIDHADFIEETKGMHCNKFTVPSLQEFMRSVGFASLSEYHVFIPESRKVSLPRSEPSFKKAWTEAYGQGFPVEPEYLDDQLEYAFARDNSAQWHNYNSGLLEGVKVFSTKLHFDSFSKDMASSPFLSNLAAGQTVFDVGGFIGLSSLFFSKIVGDGRVLCFEPNPWNINRIRLNLSHNPSLDNHISLYPLALSSRVGRTAMIMSDNIENGQSSTSQLRAGGHTAFSHQELYGWGFQDVDVDVTTLDDFVALSGIVPDLIKVDIEGAEVEFLRGALHTLKEHRPKLFIETHNPMAVFFTIEMLREANYHLHALGEEWGNRLQVLAVPNEDTNVQLDYGQSLSKALYLLFDEHRQILRRSNEAEFWKSLQDTKADNLANEITRLRADLRDVARFNLSVLATRILRRLFRR